MGRGRDARRGSAGLFEAERERHAEACGVRRREQLLGVRAFRSLEPGRKRVVTAERAGSRFETALARTQHAFPGGRGFTCCCHETVLLLRRARSDNRGGPVGKAGWNAAPCYFSAPLRAGLYAHPCPCPPSRRRAGGRTSECAAGTPGGAPEELRSSVWNDVDVRCTAAGVLAGALRVHPAGWVAGPCAARLGAHSRLLRVAGVRQRSRDDESSLRAFLHHRRLSARHQLPAQRIRCPLAQRREEVPHDLRGPASQHRGRHAPRAPGDHCAHLRGPRGAARFDRRADPGGVPGRGE